MDPELNPPSEKIGRYLIDRPLARGGMAEVFVARAEGPAGFSKRVVIKRILPEFAGDERFVSMFLNEARLAALIDHPNVVQVFDFGQHEGSYYIAMEYIEGASLRDILRYYNKSQQAFPVTIALKWMTGVCEGLHHAHNLRDESGKLYDIVHRDISPDNILVAKSGMPKLVDFGIAKAAAQTNETVAGGMKGKFAYMSPEQIRGEPADRQLDVYALGVTLFEILAGIRPFTADSPLQLMHKVVHETAPDIRTLRPALSDSLAAIVARALAPKAERYPDVAELQSDLEEELARIGTRVASSELIAVLEQVTSARRLSKKGRAETPSRPLGPACGTPASFGPVTVEAKEKPSEEATKALDAAATVGPRGPVHRPKAPRTLLILGLLAGVLALSGIAGFIVAGKRASRSTSEVVVVPDTAVLPADPPAPPADQPASPQPTPQAAAIQAAAPGIVARETHPVGKAHAVPANAPGRSNSPSRTKPAFAKVPSRKKDPEPSAAVPEAAPKGDGRLTLRTDPWCEVFLDGEPLGTTPLVRIGVPAGPHTLLLVNGALGIRRKVSIVVKAGEELKKSILLEQEQ